MFTPLDKFQLPIAIRHIFSNSVPYVLQVAAHCSPALKTDFSGACGKINAFTRTFYYKVMTRAAHYFSFRRRIRMKLLAITSCPNGIAHTYMAAENLQKRPIEWAFK